MKVFGLYSTKPQADSINIIPINSIQNIVENK